MRQFLNQQQVEVFYAEHVWNAIAGRTRLSALEMEQTFASLADIVPVLVESPGAIAELGAFSLAPDLRSKLLPIIDARYKDEKSFINTGPVAWVNSESRFGPTIYTNIQRVLGAGGEISERIERLDKPQTVKMESVVKSPKHRLYFLCDLASVAGPCTVDIVTHYAHATVGGIERDEVMSMLELGVAMRLIDAYRQDEETYYYPRDGWKPYHSRRWVDLATERARHLYVLQRIEDASRVLEQIGRGTDVA